jgi:hypothetical protein
LTGNCEGLSIPTYNWNIVESGVGIDNPLQLPVNCYEAYCCRDLMVVGID